MHISSVNDVNGFFKCISEINTYEETGLLKGVCVCVKSLCKIS